MCTCYNVRQERKVGKEGRREEEREERGGDIDLGVLV